MLLYQSGQIVEMKNGAAQHRIEMSLRGFSSCSTNRISNRRHSNRARFPRPQLPLDEPKEEF
jgi:hypothetical protein